MTDKVEKKRGRPRKNSVEPIKEKRPVGRPRKPKVEVEKNPVGRPRTNFNPIVRSNVIGRPRIYDENTTHKTCKLCGEERELKKFAGRSIKCTICVYRLVKESRKDYYQKNKEKFLERSKERYQKLIKK